MSIEGQLISHWCEPILAESYRRKF